ALAHEPPLDVQRKARAKLYDALAELLEQNFTANEKLVPEFQELTALPATDNEKKEEKDAREQEERDRRGPGLSPLCRGRESQSRFQEALTAYLDFAAMDQGKMIAMPSGHLVVPHKWAHGRIRDLLQKANAPQREALERVFQDQWRQAEQNGGIEALQ